MNQISRLPDEELAEVRGVVAGRIVRALGTDVLGLRSEAVRLGVFGLFSSALAEKVEEANQDLRKFNQVTRLLTVGDCYYSEVREEVKGINGFLFLLARGMEMSDEQFLKVVDEFQSAWPKIDLKETAHWGKWQEVNGQVNREKLIRAWRELEEVELDHEDILAGGQRLVSRFGKLMSDEE
jgi:hypothetical protein